MKYVKESSKLAKNTLVNDLTCLQLNINSFTGIKVLPRFKEYLFFRASLKGCFCNIIYLNNMSLSLSAVSCLRYAERNFSWWKLICQAYTLHDFFFSCIASSENKNHLSCSFLTNSKGFNNNSSIETAGSSSSE